MYFKQSLAVRDAADSAGHVSITVEPRAGFSDTDVVHALEDVGADQIHILAPGFIAARATAEHLDGLAGVARIHVNEPQELHDFMD